MLSGKIKKIQQNTEPTTNPLSYVIFFCQNNQKTPFVPDSPELLADWLVAERFLHKFVFDMMRAVHVKA